ncbi:hypothetical protein [Pedobacter sp. SL55]|uniref:hypothetical protein n=1 Tax=Pedobacter sp. SL55 TaxID=2995161 RepID=UPI002271C512|nr:hypothetical protein [Pedobacter sp. SL55]WAC40841.1 hypothetical protein OVA16_00185 [Pedobacter sp. SL55]
MKFSKLPLLFAALLTGCVGNMNPTGGNGKPDYPYFVTTKPLIVKKIAVPAGTTLVYEESWLKKGKQDKMLSESKLTAINLPVGATINWGGVPITSISQFFNSEMRGFTVYADFSKLDKSQTNRFIEMWQSCDDNLGIAIKNRDDWSFNPDNIVDVQSCSVLYQRYFKDNKEQQRFLDEMYTEMMKSGRRN